jgi:hypothetical protein
MSGFLLIAGVVVFSLALRTIDSLLVRKLSVFGFLTASFLIGWFASDWWPMGLVFVSFWLVWPWYDLITRYRKIAMPADKTLRHKQPPHREFFPALDELTEEIEGEGFEHLEDLGRDWEEMQQFFRIFHKADERIQAAICLVEQEQIGFYYLRLVSRSTDGTVWTTWNYPFAPNLKPAPEWKLNRESSEKNLPAIARQPSRLPGTPRRRDRRAAILRGRASRRSKCRPSSAPKSPTISPPASCRRSPDGAIRYTWRGLFFIWLQFLRDFVRLH